MTKTSVEFTFGATLTWRDFFRDRLKVSILSENLQEAPASGIVAARTILRYSLGAPNECRQTATGFDADGRTM
ncbi:MAG: hypothetical protein WBN92_01270, partial [Terriglobia bacterium]